MERNDEFTPLNYHDSNDESGVNNHDTINGTDNWRTRDSSSANGRVVPPPSGNGFPKRVPADVGLPRIIPSGLSSEDSDEPNWQRYEDTRCDKCGRSGPVNSAYEQLRPLSEDPLDEKRKRFRKSNSKFISRKSLFRRQSTGSLLDGVDDCSSFMKQMSQQVVVMAPIFGFFGKVDTKVWYSIILLLLLFTHICVGAHVFKLLETGDVATNRTGELQYKGDFLRHFLTIIGTVRPDNITRDKLTDDNISKMLVLYKSRCFKTDNSETDARMWNFWTSFDFASTIVSTIGYGGMAPKTETGKLFVIIYTIPGMLIMMSYLNIFSTCILIILRKIIKIIRKLAQMNRMPDIVEQGIVLWISMMFLTFYLITMATLMHLSNPENDSFTQSLYFYVISMTTVGFGDITLIDHTYLVLIRVLLVFCIGLVMVSLVFNAIRELAAAYQRRIVEMSAKIAMKTLAVAKHHRLNHQNAISNGGSGNEKLMGNDG